MHTRQYTHDYDPAGLRSTDFRGRGGHSRGRGRGGRGGSTSVAASSDKIHTTAARVFYFGEIVDIDVVKDAAVNNFNEEADWQHSYNREEISEPLDFSNSIGWIYSKASGMEEMKEAVLGRLRHTSV